MACKKEIYGVTNKSSVQQQCSSNSTPAMAVDTVIADPQEVTTAVEFSPRRQGASSRTSSSSSTPFDRACVPTRWQPQLLSPSPLLYHLHQ